MMMMMMMMMTQSPENTSKILATAHQSPKYLYLRGNQGCRIQRRLRKCWICRL